MITKTNNVQILTVGNLSIKTTRKKVRHLRLSIRTLDGEIRVTAPNRLPDKYIIQFIQQKMDWINQRKTLLQLNGSLTNPELIDGQEQLYFGQRIPLQVLEGKKRVRLEDGHINLFCNNPSDRNLKAKLLDAWYRQKLNEFLSPEVIQAWEKAIGVKSLEIRIKKMKTRWGSCNTRTGRIWLNLELAKKPYQCIEYVLVHELVHLLERSHNQRFKALMTEFLPDWRERKQRLRIN